MSKLLEAMEAAEPKEVKKLNRHVVIALNHMNQRKRILVDKRGAIQKEIEELDAAIQALE